MLGEGGAGGEGLTCVGMSRGQLLILPNLEVVLRPPTLASTSEEMYIDARGT